MTCIISPFYHLFLSLIIKTYSFVKSISTEYSVGFSGYFATGELSKRKIELIICLFLSAGHHACWHSRHPGVVCVCVCVCLVMWWHWTFNWRVNSRKWHCLRGDTVKRAAAKEEEEAEEKFWTQKVWIDSIRVFVSKRRKAWFMIQSVMYFFFKLRPERRARREKLIG